MLTLLCSLRCSLRRTRADDEGSVPEWVMLLVMGVGIVVALWAIVQPALGEIVTDALDRLAG